MKIGVLGGGQLGRMMFQETVGLDLDIHFLDTSRHFPVGKIAQNFVEGDFTKYDDVMDFGKDKDVITIEIEKVNVEALETLKEMGKKVHPSPSSLRIIQDKGLQKQFYDKHQLPTSSYELFASEGEVVNAVKEGRLDLPFVQKARKDGYDGKGVFLVRTEDDLNYLLKGACLVESLVDINKELAVIACRNERNQIVSYDVVEMVFDQEANLVKFLFAPAEISAEIEKQCKDLAEKLIEQFDICGLLAVEFFLTNNNEILINEVAPRPHNSGHHTIDASICSQFENHLRGVIGFPLGSTSMYKSGAMVNILGEEGFMGKAKYLGLEDVLNLDDVHIHMYGKEITKPKRKMGHINVLGENRDQIEEKINKINNFFKVIA